MNVYADGKVNPVFARLCEPLAQPAGPNALDGVAQGETARETRPTVRYIRRAVRQIPDFVNFVGGAKQIEDRLVEAGLIAGDSEKEIKSIFSQEKVSKGEVGTLIEITYPD